MQNNFGIKIKVPFTDLSVKDQKIFLKKINTVLKRGNFVLGKEVDMFEREFAAYLEVKYCVGVASGTDAILLALRALDISQDDEVIVPAFTFVASATPILMLGARAVFVDIKPNLPIIDENKVEKAITKKTKAIIAVHLYGYPCNLQELQSIAKKHRIALVEDASQAHGSLYKNKKIGSFGDIATFSFYPTKNLGAFGDAGAIVTSDKLFYEKLLLLRNHGQATKYAYKILGYNSRLDSLQAGVLRLKLKSLDTENRKKKILVNKYVSKLSNLPTKICFIDNRVEAQPAFHLFVIRTKERDRLKEFLQKRGIVCAIHYPTALPDESIFNYKKNNKYYLNARRFASSVLSLPLFPGMSERQLQFVTDSIIAFLQNIKTALV